jgi:transposase InsO family protein
MPQHYDETFKKQIVRLLLEEGRSIRSIIEEYGMSKASIINWCNEFREECQNNPESQNEYDSMKEIKVFDNLLNQDFQAEQINQKWATDFTYLFLKDGSVRYNCSVIDLHDRSVVSSITDRNITTDLAIRTVKKALEAQTSVSKNLILHSDQGAQFTSKEFTEFCESAGITQSMSKAGYPYDNAPMERYFNTLKNEWIYLHDYLAEDDLYASVEEFAYVWYNHVRPHSYNGYKTPFEARTGISNY